MTKELLVDIERKKEIILGVWDFAKKYITPERQKVVKSNVLRGMNLQSALAGEGILLCRYKGNLNGAESLFRSNYLKIDLEEPSPDVIGEVYSGEFIKRPRK